jgi:hypothetical protein
VKELSKYDFDPEEKSPQSIIMKNFMEHSTTLVPDIQQTRFSMLIQDISKMDQSQRASVIFGDETRFSFM